MLYMIRLLGENNVSNEGIYLNLTCHIFRQTSQISLVWLHHCVFTEQQIYLYKKYVKYIECCFTYM